MTVQQRPVVTPDRSGGGTIDDIGAADRAVVVEALDGQAARPAPAGTAEADGADPNTTGRPCAVFVDRAWSATVAVWGPLGTGDARRLEEVALGLVEGEHALGVTVDLRRAEVEDDDALAAVLAKVVAAAQLRGVELSVSGPAGGRLEERWSLDQAIATSSSQVRPRLTVDRAPGTCTSKGRDATTPPASTFDDCWFADEVAPATMTPPGMSR